MHESSTNGQRSECKCSRGIRQRHFDRRAGSVDTVTHMKFITWAVVLVLILIGGYWFLQGGSQSTLTTEEGGLGAYEYICDNGSTFTMMPSSDISSIKLFAGSQGMFTGDATLSNTGSGTRFEGTHAGNSVIFVGAGEEVQLTVGSESTICNPKPSAEMAPWNWGDPGEGGGIKQDVALIVGESIVGKWQSTEDAKFTREFKDGGVAVDTYEGKDVTNGTWKVFTKENPLQVSFPIEAGTVYIQMTMQGTQGDTLNFKLSKLTPEKLELIYMDRGGVLTFKSVK